MTFTSYVDHGVSIQTLRAAFLAGKSIFALVYCIPRELYSDPLRARVRVCLRESSSHTTLVCLNLVTNQLKIAKSNTC